MILGIGTDLAEVARYHFDERKLAWFARKIYTEEEYRYAMRMRLWAERLAGFYAAKEATRKAFGFAIPWRLVGVSHERSGKPLIRLYGKAAGLDRPLRRHRRPPDDHAHQEHGVGGRHPRRRPADAAVAPGGRLMRALTARQMRAVDARACARAGEVALMHAAGERVAEAIGRAYPSAKRIVAFAGPGNNGGDAFAAWRAWTRRASASSTPHMHRSRARPAATRSGARAQRA